MTTIINAENISKDAIVVRTFGYIRTDNHKQCMALELVKEFRTIDEPRGTKYADSKGFVRLAQDVREACKALGVKAYYTSNIEEYVKDVNGNFVVENGLPKKITTRGWLFEIAGKDSVYDEALAKSGIEAALEKMVEDVKNGSVVLKEVKEKAPKKAKTTKSELEAENNLLKKQLADMAKMMAELKAAIGK